MRNGNTVTYQWVDFEACVLERPFFIKQQMDIDSPKIRDHQPAILSSPRYDACVLAPVHYSDTDSR